MDADRIEDIYRRLEGRTITLHPDPVTMGARYLQEVIAKTRGYLNDVGVLLQEILQEKHLLGRQLRAAKVTFQIDSDKLLVEDDSVSTLPSIEDRKAKINTILSCQVSEIVGMDTEMTDIEALEKALRFRHRELEQTMSAIRLQKSLLESEMVSGGAYGDNSDTSRKHVGPHLTDVDTDNVLTKDDFDEMFAEINGPPPEEEVPETPEEDTTPSDKGVFVVKEEPKEALKAAKRRDSLADMEDFFEEEEAATSVETPAAKVETPVVDTTAGQTYNGLCCVVCGEPQFETKYGPSCKNGHGGADGTEKATPDSQPVGDGGDSDHNQLGSDMMSFLEEDDALADFF